MAPGEGPALCFACRLCFCEGLRPGCRVTPLGPSAACEPFDSGRGSCRCMHVNWWGGMRGAGPRGCAPPDDTSTLSHE